MGELLEIVVKWITMLDSHIQPIKSICCCWFGGSIFSSSSTFLFLPIATCHQSVRLFDRHLLGGAGWFTCFQHLLGKKKQQKTVSSTVCVFPLWLKNIGRIFFRWPDPTWSVCSDFSVALLTSTFTHVSQLISPPLASIMSPSTSCSSAVSK